MRKLKLEELNRLSLSAYAEAPKLPVAVVLDNVRSALNVGSVFRTVDGLGLQEIYLCGITSRPPHKEISKTAIGATHSVQWQYFESLATAIEDLKSKGYLVLGIEQTNESQSLETYKFSSDRDIAIVLGNEVEGISDEILDLLDASIEIPQYGTKHSFNVSVCAGMILWEISRQLRTQS